MRACKVILLIIALISLAGCKETLHTNLSENDANAMVSILLRNGLDGEKFSDKKGRHGIKIDRSQIADAVQLLKEYGFPKEDFESMGEIFKKEGLLSSPLAERARYIFALSQSIQEMLTRIDGVLIARVNVVLPQNNPFADNIQPSAASVMIQYHPQSTIVEQRSEIKQIVTKSIEGLAYEKVSLWMVPAMTPPENSQPVRWQRALGLKLTPDSVGGFWLIVASLMLLLSAALGGCGFLSWRLRLLRKQHREDAENGIAVAASSDPAGKPAESIFRVVTG